MAHVFHDFERHTGSFKSKELEPAVLSDGSEHPYNHHLPRSNEVGLGYELVLRSLDEAFEHDERLNAKSRLNGNDIPDTSDYHFPSLAIAKTRTHLARLGWDKAQDIAIRITEDSPFLRRKILGDQPQYADGKVVGWTDEQGNEIDLAERGRTFLSRIAKQERDELGVPDHLVSDDVVLNFAQWLAHATQEKQAVIDSEAREHINEYRAQTILFVRSQNLPAEAIDRLTLLDDVNILADDGFMMGSHGADPSAWYQRMHDKQQGTDHPLVVIGHGLEGWQKVHVLGHELTHAISSSTESGLDRHDMLQPLLGDFGATIINEALTEHWNARRTSGEFDRTEPDNGVYTMYRTLFDTLCHRGKIVIDPREWYSTLYFAEYGKENDIITDDRVIELELKLDRAFPGIDVFNELRQLRAEGKGQVGLDMMVEELNDKLIHASAGDPVEKGRRGGSSRTGLHLARVNLALMRFAGGK